MAVTNMNLILVLFSLLTSSVILSGALLLFETKLPTFVIKSIRYGKFAYKDKKSDKMMIEVPKSWFKHFYCIGVLFFTVIFFEASRIYIFNSPTPSWLQEVLNITCGTNRQSFTIKVYVSIALMWLQVCRRFYDTHFVSIFGTKAKINVSHYLIGLIHYPGCALAIICEAPIFSNRTVNASNNLKWADLSHFDLVAIILFLWAWWHQHATTKILADLRKDQNGQVTTNSHKLPQGDWFYFLSCPHQTAEILMYFSITILLWYNITWFFVFVWVLSNQIVTITLSHQWYQRTFEKFPKHRKAFIPYLF